MLYSLRNAADAHWYVEYYPRCFPGYRFISQQKLRRYNPYRGRICLTKLVQVVHPFLTIYIIPTSDLLMARAFILDFFRQNLLRELICIQHR